VCSKILSRRDLDFVLYEWLDVQSLTSRPRFNMHSKETFDAVLGLSEKISTNDFAPHNAKSDRRAPEFDGDGVLLIDEIEEALNTFASSGMLAGAMDDSVGGVQLPHLIQQASFAWLQAANIGTANYAMLTMANANLLIAHGAERHVLTYVRPMLEGRFFGTMCLSEPQAGSSLSDIATWAEPTDDGTYRLTGSKMWISGGDHELGENIIHLVLARTPKSPPGVKGLSLFIVPKFLVNDDGSVGERNDVVLAGINHKMGNRGTVNTFLSFGEGRFTPRSRSGAIGYLVGNPNQGLEYMFHMMNEARIGVGAGAVALGYTGYLHALEYARSRLQGRPSGAKNLDSAQIPIVRHADVRRMLLASKSYVEGGMALVMYCARLLDEQETGETQEARSLASLLLDVLTPIAKAWPSQWCLVANDLAIQIHGGYGYSIEYPVEQFYRDNRLNMIHEGTNGVQAIDLLGRKVIMNGGSGLKALNDAITATITKSGPNENVFANELDSIWRSLLEATEILWKGADATRAMANSSLYLEVVGHLVVGWLWLDQLIAVGDKQGKFYEGKRLAARYFFEYELPLMKPKLDILASRNQLFVDLDDTSF
jgi:alkylation response protein AidB-like acyl-CoA dehydrogenase